MRCTQFTDHPIEFPEAVYHSDFPEQREPTEEQTFTRKEGRAAYKRFLNAEAKQRKPKRQTRKMGKKDAPTAKARRS